MLGKNEEPEPQERALSNQEIYQWLSEFNWSLNKKEKNALVTLIEKSNIKTYVANLENLAFNLRVNISIVRSNMKMCKDAFQLFHKPKSAQDGTNNQSFRATKLKSSQFSTLNPQ